jgi:hypothetical protein
MVLRVVVLIFAGCMVLLHAGGKPAAMPSITLATDKIHYVSGDVVRLVVSNNLDISIWHLNYIHRDLVFWNLEKAHNNGWKRADFRLPLMEGGKDICRIIMHERPIGFVDELKPHSQLLYQWDQNICPYKTVTAPFQPEMIERNKYRFAFSYSLSTVKLKDNEAEPWKRVIDLGETTVAYSNEFDLN